MTRKYEFRDAEERTPLDAIVKTTFPTLLQVFQVVVLNKHARIILTSQPFK